MRLTDDEVRQVIIFLTLYSGRLEIETTPFKNVYKLIKKFEYEEKHRKEFKDD